MTLPAFLPNGNIELREFWNAKVEMLLIRYHANIVVSNILALPLTELFRLHKSDINTGKERCSVTNHLFNFCCSSANKSEYLQVKLIENVSVQNDDDIDKVFWEREKYWQTQLFTLSHGLNNPNKWYALNIRGYTK